MSLGLDPCLQRLSEKLEDSIRLGQGMPSFLLGCPGAAHGADLAADLCPGNGCLPKAAQGPGQWPISGRALMLPGQRSAGVLPQ